MTINKLPTTNSQSPVAIRESLVANLQSPIAIKAENICKMYRLQKQRTFKEFLPALIGRKETVIKFNALNHINIEIKKGESLGILGRNGSGKSTLLKIIAGVTKPSDGRITVNGRIAPLIELGAGFHPELTGRENVYLNGSILGIRKKQMDKLYDQIVAFSELAEFMDQPVKYYSSGMYTRLAFSVAVAETPDILLVDEILAVGDANFQKKCLARMEEFRKSGSTMVMVSHGPEQLEKYCDKGLLLDQGNQVFYGSIKEAVE
ncbi:ABC transporter ATP-binding protein, partial [Candidatus Roizmanbacteria bacterium CG_4_10_14_0_8_um_filter_33_9]